jgi:hypothetical protein
VEGKARGKVKGETRLKLALNKVTVKGKPYPMQAKIAEQTAKGKLSVSQGLQAEKRQDVR